MKLTKATLMVTFGASLVTANVTASKLAFFELPIIGGAAVPAGFLAIGVAFLCTDLMGELYGRDVARATVNGTVIALGVAYALVYASISMPAAPFYESAAQFETVLGASSTIIVASIITTLVSQNVDVSVFHYLRDRFNGRHKWARNLGSTLSSQLVDTTLFIVLGFVVLPVFLGGTTTPLAAVPSLIVAQYALKVVVAFIDTPLFYSLSSAIPSVEQPS